MGYIKKDKIRDYRTNNTPLQITTFLASSSVEPGGSIYVIFGTTVTKLNEMIRKTPYKQASMDHLVKKLGQYGITL